MARKNLLKLGIIVTVSTIITTACMVGCSYEEEIEGKPLLSNPFEMSSEDQEKWQEGMDDLQKEFSATMKTFEEETDNSETKEESESEEDIEVEEDTEYQSMDKATIVRVVDGDTYVVRMGEEELRVRLIGVDAPESVASQEYLDRTGKENTDFGKEVSDYMKEKLKEGDTIFLEFDVDKFDKYDRILAYAYFDNGVMIQKHLLEKGYARVMTVQPNDAHSEEFIEIEQKAMQEGVGMWENYEELFEDMDEQDINEEDIER